MLELVPPYFLTSLLVGPLSSHPDLQILAHYVFLIPIVVGVLCECTKLTVASIKKGHVDYDAFFHSGGFPSSHAAFVTSLLIIVWRKTGLDSVEFAIAAVFAVIIFYDAMNSRREIGLQAEVLNRLQHWQRFQTRVGHSFIEVLGGIVFGAVVTWVGVWLST